MQYPSCGSARVCMHVNVWVKTKKKITSEMEKPTDENGTLDELHQLVDLHQEAHGDVHVGAVWVAKVRIHKNESVGMVRKIVQRTERSTRQHEVGVSNHSGIIRITKRARHTHTSSVDAGTLASTRVSRKTQIEQPSQPPDSEQETKRKNQKSIMTGTNRG